MSDLAAAWDRVGAMLLMAPETARGAAYGTLFGVTLPMPSNLKARPARVVNLCLETHISVP
jgi:hypothetical protein